MSTNVCAMAGNGTVVEGNATPSDVRAGKTFMSESSDDIQTGALNTKKTITISVDHSWGQAQGYNRITIHGPFGSREYDAGWPTGQSHSGMGSFSFDVEI